MNVNMDLPLKLFKRGKVRDVYAVDDQLLIVSTDRISAFDYVLPSLIPDKGKVLNQLSSFWFQNTSDFIPNHVVSYRPEKLDRFKPFKNKIKKRAILAKRVSVFPIEAIVRGYIVGSGWKSYQEKGEICKIPMPDGLKFADRLEEPLFTPSTKAEQGHDISISLDEVKNTIGRESAERIRDLSLSLFVRVRDRLLEKGIVLADTKFEFGQNPEGDIILVDEIFTPDSSRFWKLSDYESARAGGQTPPSYDKQYVRNFLLESSWDRNSTPPQLPDPVIQETSKRYREIYRMITGKGL